LRLLFGPAFACIFLMMKYLYAVCFSLLSLALRAGPNDPVVALGIELLPINISCAGLSDGGFKITLLSGGVGISYQWASFPIATVGGVGTLSNNGPVDVLQNLPPGNYRFVVSSTTGMDTTFIAALMDPLPLSGGVQALSNYNGFPVACADGPGSGMVQAMVQGGTPGYSYSWSAGSGAQIATGLPAGDHLLRVVDGNGCLLELPFALNAPAPIQPQIRAVGEKCLGQHNGLIEVTAVSGGVGPFSVQFEGETRPLADALWGDLPPGTYFLDVLDANGCPSDQGVVLPSGLEFEFEIGADTSMFSGDTLLLPLSGDLALASLRWTPADAVEVDTAGRFARFFPFSDAAFTVSVQDTNGCQATDAFALRVRYKREVYAPNVFSPVSNVPENQYFTLYGGGGITQIAALRVFDRFGRLWFEGQNLPLGVPTLGWDGRGGGDDAQPGVYFWQALLQFSDGRRESYQGDLTLLR
jgi:hypothetical protein